MSLRLRINLIVGTLTALFVLALLGQQYRSMRAAVQEEVVAANRDAAQLLNRSAWGYAAQGTSAMLGYLEGIGRVRSNDITLFDAQGRELYRSPPSAYKAGREAPAWFDRLIAPAPTVQAIEFPDGKLVVQSNASRAVLDAWDEFVGLAAGAILLLVAVNGLVLWGVGRAVRPFGKIVEALNQLQAGRFDVELPPLPGREAGAIGAAFNRMVGVLRENLEAERRAMRAERELSGSRELARWIDHHIEQERRLIARELHDELGQSVTAIRSMALSIAQRVRATDPSSEQAARLIADESSKLYDAMHGLIPRLAPTVLDKLGLEAALNDLVERTRRSHPAVTVELRVELGTAVVGADAALALYRATQEGITNALRHGQARRLRADVAVRDGRLVLDLHDDGRGLPIDGTSAPGHYGLRWIEERVEALGGRLRVEPGAPRGVHLQVSLPQPS
jgi:two-component system sensor histidine kinase UhpB